MAKYTLATANGDLILRDDGARIPSDTKNSDYRDFVAWQESGGIPDPYIPPPTPDALDGWDIITLKIAFNHENRIRSLEGKAAITVTQFKTAVKALT